MFAHHFYYMFPLKQKKINFSSRDSECGTRQLNNSGLFSLETKQRAIKNCQITIYPSPLLFHSGTHCSSPLFLCVQQKQPTPLRSPHIKRRRRFLRQRASIKHIPEKKAFCSSFSSPLIIRKKTFLYIQEAPRSKSLVEHSVQKNPSFPHKPSPNFRKREKVIFLFFLKKNRAQLCGGK